MASPAVDIAPNDPIVAYFLSAPGAVEIDKLHLELPALRALRAAGVKLVVPLVSQGELVGLLNLGPHMSEQDYSTDDRVLLNNLAIQAAPAVRVAQLVREQQSQVRARERIEQELRVARLIQQTLLPKDLPAIPGWRLSARYLPAREVGATLRLLRRGQRVVEARIVDVPPAVGVMEDDIRQPFVVRIRQIPLEGCGLDGIDRQNRNDDRVASKRLFILPNYASADVLDLFGDAGGGPFCLLQLTLGWP